MPTSLSPLLGYNTNVKHRGKVFHVQTEDSGARYGHVITHLFVDGGRILKSFKSSYAEHVGSEQQGEVVRNLMKRQHKAMLLALRDGRFDALAQIDEGSDPGPAPLPSRPAATLPNPPVSNVQPATTPNVPVVIPKMPGGVPLLGKGSSLPQTESGRAAVPFEAQPNHRRATALHADELPRPVMTTTPSASASDVRAGSQAAGAYAPTSQRRVVPSRPSSSFGQAKLRQGKSIFGEDAASDKSLDEVILSYLAMDDPQGKG